MSEPLVCCVMLTKDRPEMAARAVRAFREQTYPNKRLLIWDTGDPGDDLHDDEDALITTVYSADLSKASIGSLRNQAVAFWTEFPVIVHWDSDDWSHPNRIAEQVAHLQLSGADAVGYSELLFWRTRMTVDDRAMPEAYGEAWLFKNALRPPGTSLCYWRKTWERKPFPDLNVSEDTHWLIGLDVASVRGFADLGMSELGEPRIIASIHGNNTADYDIEGMIARGSLNWERTPFWDSYCQEKMKL